MNNYGISFEEAIELANKLAEIMRKVDPGIEINCIQHNPNLSWWQKRKLTKRLAKLKEENHETLA